MEDLIYLFSILIIGIFIILPIITLTKLSSANRTIRSLSEEVKELNDKLRTLLGNIATKQDIEELLSKTSPSKDWQAKEAIPTPLTELKEEVSPPLIPKNITEEPIPEQVQAPTPIEEEILPAFAVAAVEPLEESNTTAEPEVLAAMLDNKLPEKNFIENIFGGNLLAKIGIITLVLGIGFFVKYAIDQGWINEFGRVAIGLATGAIIIGVAHRLKEQYNVFSSILVGGGISVFYITITLAFREYEIFNQTIAFVLLIMITVFSIILSLLYKRQELAVFSLVGGVLAPLMISTGTGSYIFLFSYMLLLNMGMLIISLKKDWKLIGILAYVFSIAFFWGWLFSKFETEYLGATIFASLFFIQFYVLAIIKHFREGKKMSAFQVVLILTNNLSILLACMYILDNYTPDLRGIATIAIAIVNAGVMTTLFCQSKVDKNMIYLIIAVVMSFVSLTVPIQLQGHVITMFWAVESVLLLWLWQKSRIHVFRLGFIAIGFLSVISYIIDVEQHYTYAAQLYLLSNKIFITGVVLLISFGINVFLLKKEGTEEEIYIKRFPFIKVKHIQVLYQFIFVLLLFIVPYLELNHQLEVYTDVNYASSFRKLTLATYTSLFIAGITLVFKNKIGLKSYCLLLAWVLYYALSYRNLSIDLRDSIYIREIYSKAHFLIHFLSVPAAAYTIYLLVKKIRLFPAKYFKALCWGLVILSVYILDLNLDNLIIGLFGNTDNYYEMLYALHTFGYPILWGLVAMLLMIWGLKKKEVTLRKISLIFFALIILKFYAYDVWRMSQAGRIVSFVMLGVILLIVSFMQQKIKILVQEDEDASEEQDN